MRFINSEQQVDLPVTGNIPRHKQYFISLYCFNYYREFRSHFICLNMAYKRKKLHFHLFIIGLSTVMRWTYPDLCVCSLSRHLWNGIRRWGWKADVQGELPLHVSGEERQWYKQRSQISPPCPRGCHSVHLSASVCFFECLCPLRWGEAGYHEGNRAYPLF